MITEEQKRWFRIREIKIGNEYSFPSFGFTIYERPNYSSGMFLDTNPLTKSLTHEYFVVKDIDGDFARVNFVRKPYYKDFYLTVSEIECRSLFETLFLYLILYIPFTIYNLYGRRKTT